LGLLARSHGYVAGTGAWSSHNFYQADAGGNITAMANNHATAASLVAQYRYDPFGRIFYQSGTLASANTYRFSSKEQMPNSGLYYYGFRFYDPLTQRWLNRDPMGEEGGINLYAFVNNSPLDWIDPDGESGVAIPLPTWAAPKTPNPVNCAFAAGALAGTGLCLLFPDIMTKPGEWIGNWICPITAPAPTVLEMSKPRRNAGRAGHRGTGSWDDHSGAMGHGGSRPPNFTPKPKRPVQPEPVQEPPPSTKPRFPNPGQAPNTNR
jgi:RHS repeat-associated protein